MAIPYRISDPLRPYYSVVHHGVARITQVRDPWHASCAETNRRQRWLILHGQEEEAMDVLSALADLPPDDKYVANEFAAIKDTVLEMEAATFRDLFSMDEDRNFHRVVLAYVNQVFQQVSGIILSTRDLNANNSLQSRSPASILSLTTPQPSTRTRSVLHHSYHVFLLLVTAQSTSLPPGSQFSSLRRWVDASSCSLAQLACPSPWSFLQS